MLFILAVLLGFFCSSPCACHRAHVPGALVLYCSRFHFVSFGSTSAPVDLSAWPSLANDFSRSAKRMSSQLLEIYRQLEKFSSFLLFILSHANGASGRFFHFFQQRSSCGKTALYCLNGCILCKIRRGSAQPVKLLGVRSVGQAQRVASRVLEGVVVPYMGALFHLGLIVDKFVELKGLTLPVLDLIK